jgi:hypothetical protein
MCRLKSYYAEWETKSLSLKQNSTGFPIDSYCKLAL